jgi:hypothetical protein
MIKESIWIVRDRFSVGENNVATGNCDEIAIYLYSQRLEFSHVNFQLEKWENINKCTRILIGSEYRNWDTFLDAFESEEVKGVSV